LKVKKNNNGQQPGVPDYYGLYVRWWSVAEKTGNYVFIREAKRFARLAEEFGQATITEDDTLDNF
jgi:hypothetical protein